MEVNLIQCIRLLLCVIVSVKYSFAYYSPNRTFTWLEAVQECQRQNSTMAGNLKDIQLEGKVLLNEIWLPHCTAITPWIKHTVESNTFERGYDMCQQGWCSYSEHGFVSHVVSSLCQSDNLRGTMCENGYIITNAKFQQDAAHECEIHSSMLPRDLLQFCKSHSFDSTFKFWLPIKRTTYNYTIGSLNQMPSAQSLMNCRFAKFERNGTYYEQHSNCSDAKRIVCFTETRANIKRTTNYFYEKPTTQTSETTYKTIGIGPIVGGVFAIVLAVVAIVLIVIHFKRSSRSDKRKSAEVNEEKKTTEDRGFHMVKETHGTAFEKSITSNATENNENRANVENDRNLVDTEEEYDHLGDVMTQNELIGSNIYDTGTGPGYVIFKRGKTDNVDLYDKYKA